MGNNERAVPEVILPPNMRIARETHFLACDYVRQTQESWDTARKDGTLPAEFRKLGHKLARLKRMIKSERSYLERLWKKQYGTTDITVGT